MRRLLVLGLLIGCGGREGASVAADAAPDVGTPRDTNAIEHTIRVTLNDRPEHPEAFSFMVAFRDGDGVWQLAVPSSGDTYSFEAFSPIWSVAWTCNGADNANQFMPEVTVASFTTAERTTLTMDVPTRCTDQLPAVLQMTGTIANAPPGTGALYMNLLDQRAAGGDTYSLRARLGVHDLVLRKIDHPNESSTFATTSTFIERDLSVAASQHDLDLATAAATRTFAVSVPPNGTASATTLLYTKSGTIVTLGHTSNPLVTFALDASQTSTTDVYEQQIEVDGLGEATVTSIGTTAPGPVQIQPVAPLGTAVADIATTTPYPIVQASWPTYSDAIGYRWVATQPACGELGCLPITWTALLSPGVAGSAPQYRMPDLSAVPGWNSLFAFQTGLEIDGYAEAVTSSAGASDFPPVTPPAAGTQRTYVRSDFTVTP